ncbi:unnamed protein product [Ambrosiozyma monospora]|uniref:Unnamed protein product n=1 Tax=Ambrosiozyma monospora TaxID=43982 RepID=A0A9W6YW12_AMBMO|nr:unnamed protein product [Ambrosiozyma monospora]
MLQKYTKDEDWKPRLAGWWGNNAEDRFKMLEQFNPIPSALGFRQSNPSVFDVVSLQSSLETFTKCGGIKKLREKSIKLTNYLEKLLHESAFYKTIDQSKTTKTPHFIILTPENPNERGAQLSLLFKPHNDDASKDTMEQVCKYLNDRGVICDERRPNVIRLGPTPSYNTFINCFDCVALINKALTQLS